MSVGSRAGAIGLLLPALLSLALVLGAVPATATAPDAFSIVDVPDGENAIATAAAGASGRPLLARMSPAQVDVLVADGAGVRGALTRRPGARTVLRFDGVHRQWVATVRERGSVLDLARVTVDDRTGRIVDTYALSYGDYPSQLTADEAIDAALADPRVRRAARRFGGIDELRATSRLDGCCWEVDLTPLADSREHDADDVVVRVDVFDATGGVTGVWTGVQIAWKMSRGDRGAFGGDAVYPELWLPLFVLFALVAIDWTRVRSPLTLDALALLALGVSHEAFVRGHVDWSVPLALPPLVWLLGRMSWLFARGLPAQSAPREPRTRLGRVARRRVPTALVVLLAVALAGARIGVTLDGGNVIDVGAAGVDGARLELQGRAVWGNMPANNPHGDTYGPLNYLAYVPATELLDDPRHDTFGNDIPAATWTSIVADLGCALVLALIGWRWISRRGAALLAAAWLACPWTMLDVASGVNDALLALPLLVAFAALRRPLVRGIAVGLAVCVKFAPLAALAPLLHIGARSRLRQSLWVVLGAALAMAAGLAWVVHRIPGSTRHALAVFGDRTIGFQTERGSPFSPWGLYDLPTAQHVAQGLVVLGLAAACLLPRRRDAWQVAAGCAASIIAVELVVTHWFYLYVPWFAGFVLLVLVAARERPVLRAPRATGMRGSAGTPPAVLAPVAPAGVTHATGMLAP